MVLYERPNDDFSRGLVGDWKLDDLKRIASDGIIAHYKLNDNAADTIVLDSKGGNNGVCSANTATLSSTGKINESFDFHASEYVTLPSGVGQDFSNGLSISLWCYIDAIHTSADYSAQQILITSQKTSYTNPKLLMSLRSSGYHIQFFDEGGADVNCSSLQIAGEWVHLVGVLDPASLKLRLYKNGILASEQAVSYGSGRTFAESLLIGDGQGVAPFDGKLDDIRIYDRVLSASEISSIYVEDSMVAHYKLNDNVASTDVIDSKGGETRLGTATANTDTLSSVGKLNEAFDFDGSTTSVQIPIVSGNYLSINFWANPDTVDTTGQEDNISYFFRGTTDAIGRIYIIQENSAIKIGIGDNGTLYSSSSVFTAGTWAHISLNLDNGHYYLYKDGSLIADGNYNAQTQSETFFIGSFSDLKNYFDGKIDDFRIYNRPLSISEVQTLYNSGTGTEETTILAPGTETTELFRSDIVAIDRGKFNDGTINGVTNSEGINGLNADAMYFDGVDDYVRVSNTSGQVWNGNDPYSISIWFKSEAKLTDLQRMISHPRTGTPGNRIYITLAQSVNEISATIGGKSTTYYDYTPNVWNNVVLTKDAESSITAKFYLNGVLLETLTNVGSDGTTGDIFLGAFDSTGQDVVKGTLAKVHWVNRVLNKQEIKEIYRLKK